MKLGHQIGMLMMHLCLYPGPAGQAAEQDYAPVMPLAAQSLLLDLAVSGSRLLAAGERGHILYSDDGGSDWYQSRVPTRQMLTSICFVDGRRGWAAGHDGLILASDDAGETWRIQRNGLVHQEQLDLEQREAAHKEVTRLEQALHNADSGDDIAELEMALTDAKLQLEDAELTLQESPYAPPLMDIWFQDKDHGWTVGAFGTLLATSDGGHHWKDRSLDLDNPEELHLNTVVGDGAGRVFVAGERGVMFRSLDAGQTWQPIAAGYEGSWFGALYNSSDDVLLAFGLRGQLYRSPDFGAHWRALQSGTQMTLTGGSISEDESIVIVGSVGTVLHSVDGGHTFIQQQLPQRPSLSAGLRWANLLLLAGQGGVHKLPLETSPQ